MLNPTFNGERYELHSPITMPNASAFLWNKKMMIHMNCRGYAVSQFMQPEPTKYAHAPNIEAKTFMQPEQPYYAHHPGRFFYIKDEEDNSCFSLPYEPVRAKLDSFIFSAGKSDIKWLIKNKGLEFEVILSLPVNEAFEIWTIKVLNSSNNIKKINLYPYFPVGYMSWMNQSGEFNKKLNAIVCSSVTPYQKYSDYYSIKEFKDKTFLLADKKPDSWEVNQKAFEGEGGLHNPSGVQREMLENGNALYETPAGIFHFKMELGKSEKERFNFIFGAAKSNDEIEAIKNQYFESQDGLNESNEAYSSYISHGSGCVKISTPDKEFDNFVNHWLPRQVYYHGTTNRLCTDPQTRNFLQDNMGMSYIDSEVTRKAFVLALSQQDASGAMPDGILLQENAELKYINQIPHTDHCVWLPVCLKAYLDETNNYEFLNQEIPYANNEVKGTVIDHINRAMLWLESKRDQRGLNYINQGDWCDPMNMVGYKGRGVSGWLTIASAYAFKVWAEILENNGLHNQAELFKNKAEKTNKKVNEHLWDGKWFARGITDDNVKFGIQKDSEGKIFLNPQAWALLSGAANESIWSQMVEEVNKQLESPYGIEMLAPAFTKMREDVGRVTQKFPGSAENGSVYNHAAAFYIYGLYSINHGDSAYRLLRKMIPGPDKQDILKRGQLPVFVPNYYRGAYKQFPRTAGRSSQLFNTGTASWFYRIIIDGLLGIKGTPKGLNINPNFPSEWDEASVLRSFRGARFDITYKRDHAIKETEIYVDQVKLSENCITQIEAGKNYAVLVKIK